MIESLSDLKKFFKICRDAGVTDASAQGMTFKFGEMPGGNYQTEPLIDEVSDKYANFPQGILSHEELTAYAQGAVPPERESA